VAPVSTAEFVLALAFGTISALIVFSHADRHGSKRATAWGIAAFFAGGLVLAVYFIRYWLRNRAS
jgi:hypothetical protein